jgi:hypothetical protein
MMDRMVIRHGHKENEEKPKTDEKLGLSTLTLGESRYNSHEVSTPVLISKGRGHKNLNIYRKG